MLVFLTESAKVEKVRITKSTHNICVAWDLREARWSLRRVKKVEKGTPLIQQSSSTVGTQLEFNLERQKGGNRPSSEESEKEKENSEENKSIFYS